jgi:hypothetical protein
MELGYSIQGFKLLVTRGGIRIGIVPPLELITCSHVFSPQLPLNQTCKLSSPNSNSLIVVIILYLKLAVLVKEARIFPLGACPAVPSERPRQT